MSDISSTIKSIELDDKQAVKLSLFVESLPDILLKLENPEYDEIFGYRINTTDKPHVDENIRNEILLKFLVADNYDLKLAEERLIKTLNWRNKFQPLHAAFAEKFDDELNELGSITNFTSAKPNLHVTTWNLYGNLKNPKTIFQKFESTSLPGNQFLRWRIGMMEQALQLLDFSNSELNKIAQIQDTNNVSMFSIDPGMKQGMKDIIQIFGENYPELLSVKFFINVPYIMGWVFTFFKTIRLISEETLKKFQVLNHGDLGEFYPKSDLPKNYGGENDQSIFDIDIGNTIKLNSYGQVMLANTRDKKLEDNDTEVE
ncbi:SFH5 Phosphatidylinositol transfer protein SFH5 [Candida maltosa Xu316]